MQKKATRKKKTKAERHGRKPLFGKCPYTDAELFRQGMRHDIEKICGEIDEAFDFMESKTETKPC